MVETIERRMPPETHVSRILLLMEETEATTLFAPGFAVQGAN